MTECTQESFPFAAHFSRQVIAEFSADRLTSDGGVLLLRQVDRRLDLLRCSTAAILAAGGVPPRKTRANISLYWRRSFNRSMTPA